LQQPRSIIYEVLRPAVWSGINAFFRKVVIRNKHKIPRDRPVIIVANHQNALLDPVVLCVASHRQLNWLTRADVFKNKQVSAFLHRINMMPVYRERDRVADLHDRNNAIFNECYRRMHRNAIIGIFPEGTHRGKKQLVPLKKGLARLVIGAYDSGVRNLCILPVGLDYQSFYEPQQDLMVTFGDVIEVESVLKAEPQNHAKLHAEITQLVHEALTRVMIHIDSEDVYSEILSLKPLLDELFPDDDLGVRFDHFHALARYLDTHTEHHAFLNHEVNAFRTLGHEMHIEEHRYAEKISVGRWLGLLVGIPFALLAATMLWPMQLFVERFVHTVIKDTLFRNSIRISFWTFLTPIYLLLIWLLLKWADASFYVQLLPVLAPFAGLITLPWWRNTKRILQYLRLKRRSNSDNYKRWITKRMEIKQWIQTLPYQQ
jgi:1-acyl-sn-glycerol-3-phosphate acyltransferase